MTATLVTARWSALYALDKDRKAGMIEGTPPVVPVRTSVGKPRFWPDAKDFPYIGALTPFGLTKIGDEEEFTGKYVARLEKAGVDELRETFDAIDEMYQKPLALLCFEDLTKEGLWCHRRIFATWWLEQTGETVPEIGFTKAGEMKEMDV
jgi:hypothetical protein